MPAERTSPMDLCHTPDQPDRSSAPRNSADKKRSWIRPESVERAQQGDFDPLRKDLEKAAHGHLQRALGSLRTPELKTSDLASTTIFKIYTHLDVLSRHKNPEAWIATLLKNHFIDKLRQLDSQRRNLGRPVEITDQDIAAPDEGNDGRWDRESIRKMLETLQEQDVDRILGMRFYEEMSNEVIAKELGVNRRTVDRRLNALLELGRLLASRG
ncbi:MAG: sigma-70 family RNA polymerase sigma factor [Candidatus Eisenbacteria bacterium]